MSTANTKQVVVDGDARDIPRDPNRFRPTTHFGQRLRERVPAADRDRVVRECFERGVCRGTTPARSVDRPGVVFQTFEFEARFSESALIGSETARTYALVVGVVREAFRNPRKKHRALTIVRRDDGGQR